ncbi:CDF family cobalt/cadmium/zinc transporter [Alcanivorax hongdengensis A-11-3]|uniref:CDF family cobalt/cadmium/zinc transporter n=1 Tax=Alcanivorax hongdengensis A-11-3 TaxID=1177179 RepID=L0WDD4_9GAMM|nr:cation transporter [Alcanivorax hongdengensis]EKF74783.1 CDF family cobalt/cadmium/zinc transporter [Alcanivorax hongdengensis A-11-3]
MACCEPELKESAPPSYRRALVGVLLINLLMFVVEISVGWLSGSRALRADALDFLGDTATYGLTLWALGQSQAWRLRAARIKGGSLLVMGLLVLADSVRAVLGDAVPPGPLISGIGALALVANLTSLGLLVRYRHGDANIRSVWLCSRNDAVANLAVIAAGALVLVSGSRWPDVLVAFAIAGLFTHSAVAILRQARREQPATSSCCGGQ